MVIVDVWVVLVASVITALFTGLGAVPFVFLKNISRKWIGIFNGLAAGLMLGASHQLISEGITLDAPKTLGGLLLGLILIVAADRLIENHDDIDIAGLKKADVRKTLLILGVMTAHSFAEGIGVGVSFGGGEELGFFVAAAIAVHNIPEGLAISLVLIPRGFSILSAGWWSIFSSLPQPLMAVPAFLFVLIFTPFLPVGLGLAAGAMIWMVFAELVPDALETASKSAVGAAVTLAFIAMQAFQVLILKG